MKHEMNLLPVVREKKKRDSGPKKIGRIIFLGLFMGVLAIYGVLCFLDQRCQNEIKELEAVIASKSDYQVVYDNLSAQKELLEHRRLLLESISKGKELPLQTMVEIHQMLPAGIRLLNYDFRDGKLMISGETQKKEEIMEFKERLLTRDVFKGVNMVNTRIKAETPGMASEEGWEFTFDIQLNEVQL